ncbi:saccharopine dehydrogenase C-terminal domain-containing protein [Candidatus Zixiibacteriota bacterium]
MKKILVLGAGLVSRPLVQYLLDVEDFSVTVASRTVSKAEALVGDHPHGTALPLNVTDVDKLSQLVAEHDLAISLLPYIHHVTVGNLCLEHQKHLVTTSYISEAMQALDAPAKEKGILILNEIGLDPGIDHMSAMKIFHAVQKAGGEIAGFSSYCGGLPAPEANDNPFGYKFSWSPKAVLMAGGNAAKFLRDGKSYDIPGEELFDNYWPVKIEGMEEFEGYPNRNSMPYREMYGIESTKTMFRGTLRYKGWCATLRKMIQLGVGDDNPRDDLAGLTFAGLTGKLIGKPDSGNIKKDTAAFLGVEESSFIISNMAWLGLFGNDLLPEGQSVMDVVAARMLQLMEYKPNERDMIVLHHEFDAVYPDRQEKMTSTLIDYGIPGGDSAMARTVSLPAAITTRYILEGKINLTGVHAPVVPEIYEPTLAELERLNIRCVEKTYAA